MEGEDDEAAELEALIADELLVSGGSGAAGGNGGGGDQNTAQRSRSSSFALASSASMLIQRRMSTRKSSKKASLVEGLVDHRELALIEDLRSRRRSNFVDSGLAALAAQGAASAVACATPTAAGAAAAPAGPAAVGERSSEIPASYVLPPRRARLVSHAFSLVELPSKRGSATVRDCAMQCSAEGRPAFVERFCRQAAGEQQQRLSWNEFRDYYREQSCGLKWHAFAALLDVAEPEGDQAGAPQGGEDDDDDRPERSGSLEAILELNAKPVRPSYVVQELWDSRAKAKAQAKALTPLQELELLEKEASAVVAKDQTWWPSVVRSFVTESNMTLRGFADDSEATSEFGPRLLKLVVLKQGGVLHRRAVDLSRKHPTTEPPESRASVASRSAVPTFAESLSAARVASKLQCPRVREALDRWWRALCPAPTRTQARTAGQVASAPDAPRALLDVLNRRSPLKERISAAHGVRVVGGSADPGNNDAAASEAAAAAAAAEANAVVAAAEKKRTEKMVREAKEAALQRERRKSVRKAMLSGNFEFDAATLCEVGNPFDREEGRKLRLESRAKAEALEARLQAARERRRSKAPSAAKQGPAAKRGPAQEAEPTMPLETFMQAEELIYQVLVQPGNRSGLEEGAAPGVNPAARRLALRDARRASPRSELPQSAWRVLMLELVDLWTNTADDDEYAVFLEQLLLLITASTALMGVRAARQVHRAREAAGIRPQPAEEERAREERVRDLQRLHDKERSAAERWPNLPIYLRPQAWSIQGKQEVRPNTAAATAARDGPGPVYLPSDFYVSKPRQDLLSGNVTNVQTSTVAHRGYDHQPRELRRSTTKASQRAANALRAKPRLRARSLQSCKVADQARDPLAAYLVSASKRASHRAEGLLAALRDETGCL